MCDSFLAVCKVERVFDIWEHLRDISNNISSETVTVHSLSKLLDRDLYRQNQVIKLFIFFLKMLIRERLFMHWKVNIQYILSFVTHLFIMSFNRYPITFRKEFEDKLRHEY